MNKNILQLESEGKIYFLISNEWNEETDFKLYNFAKGYSLSKNLHSLLLDCKYQSSLKSMNFKYSEWLKNHKSNFEMFIPFFIENKANKFSFNDADDNYLTDNLQVSPLYSRRGVLNHTYYDYLKYLSRAFVTGILEDSYHSFLENASKSFDLIFLNLPSESTLITQAMLHDEELEKKNLDSLIFKPQINLSYPPF